MLGSKRYAMYKLAADGTVIVRKCSEHGLGLRLDPTDPAAPVNSSEDDLDSLVTDGNPGRKWVEALCAYLIETDALGRSVAEPAWFDRPALYKTTITTPELAERLKLDPFNFILCAQPKPLQAERSELRLIVPFNTNPSTWTHTLWVDARTATRHKIATGDIDGTITDRVYVKSYRDIAIEFLARPESKLARSDGQPAGRRHRGLLARRIITAGETVHIGKEGNHIDEIEVELLRGDEALNRYTPPSIRAKTFDEHIRPIMRAFTVAEIANKTNIPVRTIERIRAGATPHHSHEKLLIDWAVRAARQALKDAGANTPADRRAILIAWTRLPKQQRTGARRTCEGCGQPLSHGHRRYHSEACRSKARRKRVAADAASRDSHNRQP